MNKFEVSVQFLVDPRDGFASEGGYVNDPADPGGETNYGISKRSYPNVDIKNLDLVGALAIYKRDYWDAYSLDLMAIPLCVVGLDSYVQHRPSAVRQLLEIAGDDWRLLIQCRREFYLKIIAKNPAMLKFKKGWMNRMTQLDKYCQIVLQDQT